MIHLKSLVQSLAAYQKTSFRHSLRSIECYGMAEELGKVVGAGFAKLELPREVLAKCFSGIQVLLNENHISLGI